MLAEIGSELNNVYRNGSVLGIDINISVKSLLCSIERPFDTDLLALLIALS